MRPTKELLELVKDRYLDVIKGDALWGLCNVAEHLLMEKTISAEEYQHLESYIREHRPVNMRTLKKGGRIGYFYWSVWKSKPRIKWLNKHIKKNS